MAEAPPELPRRRSRPPVTTIAGVAAVAVGLAIFASALASGLASSGGPGSDGGPAPANGAVNLVPEPLRGQLAAKVRTILERASPTEHHQHGHNFGDKPYPVV